MDCCCKRTPLRGCSFLRNLPIYQLRTWRGYGRQRQLRRFERLKAEAQDALCRSDWVDQAVTDIENSMAAPPPLAFLAQSSVSRARSSADDREQVRIQGTGAAIDLLMFCFCPPGSVEIKVS